MIDISQKVVQLKLVSRNEMFTKDRRTSICHRMLNHIHLLLQWSVVCAFKLYFGKMVLQLQHISLFSINNFFCKLKLMFDLYDGITTGHIYKMAHKIENDICHAFIDCILQSIIPE